MAKDTLFVYGTLRPGYANEHILKNIGGSFKEATISGFQFDKVWEKQTGYPGIIKSNSNATIKGILFTSKHLIYHWDVLDSFETDAYCRIEIPIKLNDNSIVNGCVYIINVDFNIHNF